MWPQYLSNITQNCANWEGSEGQKMCDVIYVRAPLNNVPITPLQTAMVSHRAEAETNRKSFAKHSLRLNATPLTSFPHLPMSPFRFERSFNVITFYVIMDNVIKAGVIMTNTDESLQQWFSTFLRLRDPNLVKRVWWHN